MSSFIYNLFITPIEIIVELSFSILSKILGDYGLAIIGVSLVIQTLVLPLYKRADALQDDERLRQRKMERWVKHIRTHFKGEERFMILSTYYRQQNYKSWYAIRSSASILLQIPFFIAAYHYLSNLSLLAGQKFLFIQDLSKPDATFVIGGFAINVLPIMMTAINIISGIIYTKELNLKDKLQVYGLAAVFLVLLYNSPAGLVLYWTMNNVYSLCKNIVLKLIHLPDKMEKHTAASADESPLTNKLFTAACIFLTIFVGSILPIDVISSSPTEFIGEGYSPVTIVISNIAVYAGFFLVWFRIFYGLMTDRYKKIFTGLVAAFAVTGFVNYMFWGNNFGEMSALLVYEGGRPSSILEKLINLIIVIIIGLLVYLVARKYTKQLSFIFTIIALTALCYCAVNFYTIQDKSKDYYASKEFIADEENVLTISKNGRNVVMIMLDRAMGAYVPYIFEEKPELATAFDGFTWYSDTLSFGGCTNFAAPALYGGYEYSPVEMNKRNTELLGDKHDEALLVMPRVFSDNDYSVTVTDPPYAGYRVVSDLSIYSKYEGIDAYKLEGTYTNEKFPNYMPNYINNQKIAFKYYSMMRVVPLAIQNVIYNFGNYYGQNNSLKASFIGSYSALLKMPEITEITENTNNNFIQLQNGTTHEPVLLKEPEYTVIEDANTIDVENNPQKEYEGPTRYYKDQALKLDNVWQASHYHVNVAAFEALADWFKLLQENDCWDNTRIIIVSDHGRGIGGQFEYMQLSDGLDIQWYNPLLMVKDFGAKGFTESKEFMTNADVLALLIKDIIDDPTNPFTGKSLKEYYKDKVQYVTTSYNFNPENNNGYTFDSSDGEWYEVKPGNIFDEDNWKKIEY